MRIRTLVPALACLAAAPLACAADSGPAIKFDGFVDTYYSSKNVELGSASTGFGYAGKLGIATTISEKVSAQVDLNVAADPAGMTDGSVTARQVYGTWKVVSDVELKTGKFISDYGWTGAYAPLLYRVNSGPIAKFYGVDQVGVNAKYTKGDLTAAVTLANGFFDEGDGSASQTPGQDNEAYAVGLDVVYNLGDMGSVNLELIRDEDAGTNTVAGQVGGDGYHVGLNATITPSKALTIGAELIIQSINNKGAGAQGQDTAHTGATILANYKLSNTMSVTGQISMIDIEQNADANLAVVGASITQSEYALALLTNPAGTDKLGANLEVSYISTETNGADATYDLGLAAEILYVF